MIRLIDENSIGIIEDIIEGIIASGSKKEVRINFSGGTSKEVIDLKSLAVGKEQIIVDQQYFDVKNISDITHGDKKIIIFPW